MESTLNSHRIQPSAPAAASEHVRPADAKTWPCTGGCGKGMLAPVAKCPECILATRRARDAEKFDSAGGGLAKSPEEAKARDKAVLDLLRHGPTSFDRLVTVMPGEFLSDDARSSATRSSVLRLKVKGHLRIAPEGYALA